MWTKYQNICCTYETLPCVQVQRVEIFSYFHKLTINGFFSIQFHVLDQPFIAILFSIFSMWKYFVISRGCGTNCLAISKQFPVHIRGMLWEHRLLEQKHLSSTLFSQFSPDLHFKSQTMYYLNHYVEMFRVYMSNALGWEIVGVVYIPVSCCCYCAVFAWYCYCMLFCVAVTECFVKYFAQNWHCAVFQTFGHIGTPLHNYLLWTLYLVSFKLIACRCLMFHWSKEPHRTIAVRHARTWAIAQHYTDVVLVCFKYL